jgi:peptidoglycan/LPS O-acetylase OafA/YrhL
MRRPKWWPFLQARILRILPAFWICLILTAAVIAPMGMLLAHQAFPETYISDAVMYVVKNAGLRITEFGIGATPTNVPYPGVWNGSLWTLWWEFLCYLAVLVLGLTRLLKFQATIPTVFAGCLTGVICADLGVLNNFYLVNACRFGLMFAAGALIYQLRHRLPARWWLVVLASALTLGASLLPDYRVIAALPLAYLVITVGALVKVRRLRLENDISYGTYIYAFPLQQVLASAGLAAIGVPLFAAAATALTLCVAALSWYGVEKPAMRLKREFVFRAKPITPHA